MNWPEAFVVVGVAWAFAYCFKDVGFSIKFKDDDKKEDPK